MEPDADSDADDAATAAAIILAAELNDTQLVFGAPDPRPFNMQTKTCMRYMLANDMQSFEQICANLLHL